MLRLPGKCPSLFISPFCCMEELFNRSFINCLKKCKEAWNVADKQPDKKSDMQPSEAVHHFLKAMNDFFEHRPVKGLLESMDELFSFSPFIASFPAELKESEEEYIIHAKLPGVRKEQISVDVWNQHVTISVLHHESFTAENEHKEVIRRKETMKKSTRTIPLTKPVDSQHVKASFENGLLTIRIQKLKGKSIEIM
jgi:HSP20 family molecular chaperone IbpA